jgi:hypothetical protein
MNVLIITKLSRQMKKEFNLSVRMAEMLSAINKVSSIKLGFRVLFLLLDLHMKRL